MKSLLVLILVGHLALAHDEQKSAPRQTAPGVSKSAQIEKVASTDEAVATQALGHILLELPNCENPLTDKELEQLLENVLLSDSQELRKLLIGSIGNFILSGELVEEKNGSFTRKHSLVEDNKCVSAFVKNARTDFAITLLANDGNSDVRVKAGAYLQIHELVQPTIEKDPWTASVRAKLEKRRQRDFLNRLEGPIESPSKLGRETWEDYLKTNGLTMTQMYADAAKQKYGPAAVDALRSAVIASTGAGGAKLYEHSALHQRETVRMDPEFLKEIANAAKHPKSMGILGTDPLELALSGVPAKMYPWELREKLIENAVKSSDTAKRELTFKLMEVGEEESKNPYYSADELHGIVYSGGRADSVLVALALGRFDPNKEIRDRVVALIAKLEQRFGRLPFENVVRKDILDSKENPYLKDSKKLPFGITW